MSRRMTRCADDPVVAVLTEEIRRTQELLTRLRAKRLHAIQNIKDQGRYARDPKYRERSKRGSRNYYYRVLRPKLYPHLCGEEQR